MASTSTSKQPMLVDRPLHNFAVLGAVPALTSASDFSAFAPSGCSLLVDCSGNDGGIIDSISIIANQASTTASKVLVLLSTSSTATTINSSNTACVASATIGSTAIGERTNIPLPPLLVPIPQLGAVASASETAKKNTGLLIPAGSLIYVGLDAAISAPSSATRVSVFAQGGLY